MGEMTNPNNNISITEISQICKNLIEEVGTIVVGKKNMLKYVTLGILTDGHILFEDYPGLAKTLTAKTFSKAIGCKFSRVQFTPDLLPADITGTYIYSQKTSDFKLIDLRWIFSGRLIHRFNNIFSDDIDNKFSGMFNI